MPTPATNPRVPRIEAAAPADVPISLPSSADPIRDNKSGIIIPPEDPFKLAKAIKEMKSNEDKYHEYCRNSIAAAKNFDRMKLARQMHELIIGII